MMKLYCGNPQMFGLMTIVTICANCNVELKNVITIHCLAHLYPGIQHLSSKGHGVEHCKCWFW